MVTFMAIGYLLSGCSPNTFSFYKRKPVLKENFVSLVKRRSRNSRSCEKERQMMPSVPKEVKFLE